MDRRTTWKISFLMILVFVISFPSSAQSPEDYHKKVVDVGRGGGYILSGDMYKSGNTADFCPGGNLDLLLPSPIVAGRGVQGDGTKVERVPAGSDFRNELVIAKIDAETISCTIGRDNLLHRGTCTLTSEGSSDPIVFNDICLTQTVVGECFSSYERPVRYMGGAGGQTGEGRMDNMEWYARELRWVQPRYLAVTCPSAMICSEGACKPEAEAGPDTAHLPQSAFPIGATVSSPPWTAFRLWKKEETYADAEPGTGGDYGLFPPLLHTAMAAPAPETSFYGYVDSVWEMRNSLTLNPLAKGKCTLTDHEGTVLGSEGYDKCVAGRSTAIEECYIGSGHTITYARMDCPAGMFCQENEYGARCELPGDEMDRDHDGFTMAEGDCDDGDGERYPGAPDNQCAVDDLQHGIDNNCDGIVDDGCDADEFSATCETRGLTYEGTAPGGKCCGDDADETWNLFTSSASATNGCFQGATIPVNAANPANLAQGAWTRDEEGLDVIGTGGMYPANDELGLTSAWTWMYIPAKQFHGKTMVWEFEYREGLLNANLAVTIAGVYGVREDGSTSPIQVTPLYSSQDWKKIRHEFDYDVGPASEANGILFGITKTSPAAIPKIRNFRVYPKNVEKVIYVDEQAYGCQAEETPIVSQRYNTPPIPSSGVAIPSANMKNRCETVTSSAGQNFVCDNDGIWKETPYTEPQLRSVWLEAVGSLVCIGPCPPPPPPPPTPDYDVVSKQYGCCGGGSCWNGLDCTLDNTNLIQDSSTMRCVGGEWQTEALKKDQYNHPSPTKACGAQQCFWNGPSNLAAADNADDECVDNGEAIEDYECVSGAWRSRTSMIAQQMLQMTGTSDQYTLFCDTPERVALNLEHSGEFGGIIRNAINGSGDPADCGMGTGKPCVNNICVLKFTQGGEEKVAVGMSLNVDPAAHFSTTVEDHSIFGFFPESAAYSADESYHICDGAIARPTPGWKYYGCNGDSVVEGSDANVWYNPMTNSLIYSPQGVTVGTMSWGTRIANALLNPFDSMFAAIRNILGLTSTGGIAADRAAIAEQIKFDKIYIQRDDEQSIKGILEDVEGDPEKSAMTIEYQNIPADVCTNLERIGCEEGTECWCEPSFIQKRFLLTPDQWAFNIRVKGTAGAAYADRWDDLTSKTRLDSSVSASGPGPGVPSIGYSAPTVTGSPVSFLIQSVPDEEDIIGYYWVFSRAGGEVIGKGARTRAEANIVEHTYPTDSTYDVELNVINKNFVVEQVRTTVTIPSPSGGGLTPEQIAQIRESECRRRGTCPGTPGGLPPPMPIPGS